MLASLKLDNLLPLWPSLSLVLAFPDSDRWSQVLGWPLSHAALSWVCLCYDWIDNVGRDFCLKLLCHKDCIAWETPGQWSVWNSLGVVGFPCFLYWVHLGASQLLLDLTGICYSGFPVLECSLLYCPVVK